MVTKAICNKGFSGNSSILPRIKFRVCEQNVARNPLLHIASAVRENTELQKMISGLE